MNTSKTSIGHLLAECQRIEDYCRVNAATHFILAERAGTWAKVLGVLPVAMGGAIAGVLLWDSAILGANTAKWFGLAAVIAGVLSTVMAYLNPDRARAEHMRAGVRYKTVENEAKRAYELFSKEEPREAFVLRVRELARRYDELGEASPQTQDWAYRRANERVKAGEYSPTGVVNEGAKRRG